MRRLLLAASALTTIGAAPQSAPVASFDWFAYRGADPIDSAVEPGPGQYRNPVLAGFHPDPSVLRVGDDYYLVNSTFAYFPGLPIYHSRDLVSWHQIGNAIDRPDQFDFGKLRLSRGIFAPDLSYHDGTYYLAGTCVDCGGNFVMTARDPAGPWSDPVWNKIEGIDPSLFFDADGSAWILNNGTPPEPPRYEGHRAIWIQRIDLTTLQPFGPRTVLIDGGVHPAEKPIWAEGPHIYAHDGWYYLSTAEGGTAENHSQTIWRSKSVDGPYTPGPINPILTQRDLPADRDHPITSAGHADFVTTPSGKWWATFLATRPYKGDFYNIGRETFLLPVTWHDGWPLILPPKTPIPYVHKRPDLPREADRARPQTGAFSYRDDFGGERLSPAWLMIRNPHSRWYAQADGALRLTARPAPLGGNTQPSYLGRRLQHHHGTITVRMHFAPKQAGDRAGIAILQSQDYFYTLSLAEKDGGMAVELRKRAGADDPAGGTVVASEPVRIKAGAPIDLSIRPDGARIGFAYAVKPGTWHRLPDQDATILSTKTAGGFIGATVGPFATAAH
ncbi:glycoside hydrolase family 43 protein [Stakelama marina]|uniref:Glycoside hydrolase family 43 protein n=1 Tax=Stakelama marina TaxID=2826939 RepID=A0A8T4ID68_9SPHN|nr:glycoside hydrolase family 43 protein [Stakelama marina]MBR0552520.1 glycoside hydrolase family 43 protein [Stakelama marina]